MTTTLYLAEHCDEPYYMQVSPDDAMLLSAVGRKRADTFVGSTRASYQVNGQDANGHVLYTARFGGTCANDARVRHTVGGLGGGYENRPLQVSVSGHDVTVQFGTDGNGLSVVPTASQVAALVNASEAATALLEAAAQGDGTGLAGVTAYENLAGGLDDGDLLKFEGSPPVCRRVARVEVA